MEKICTKCRYVNSKDVKFCVRCGSDIFESKAEPSSQNEQSQPIRSQSEPQSFKPYKTVKFKKSSSLEKILIPTVIIALILSIVAIALPIISPEDNLASNSVGLNQIKDDSVTGEKILDKTITDNDISDIGLSKIAANSITGRLILNGTIDTSDLSDKTIQDLSGLILIEDNSITGTKIRDGTIDTVDIKNNSITSGKIADNAITNSEIASGAVNTDEIANNSVNYNKMSIKIKYGIKSGSINGTSVSHQLGAKPLSVIVTPVYDTSILGGNYAIYANVYNITVTSFKIGLWYITFTTPPAIHEITDADPYFTSGVSVNWIAIL